MDTEEDERLLKHLGWEEEANASTSSDFTDPFDTRYPRNRDPKRNGPPPGLTRIKGDSKEKSHERPIANYYWETGETTTLLLANVYLLHQSASQSLLSNYIFITQVFELIFSISGVVIALLILSEDIAINNYIYLIASAVILLILALVHVFAISQWQEQPKFSHPHNNEIFFSFFCWLAVSFINVSLLGIWLLDKKDSSCCSFEDSQPSQLPPFNTEQVQFFGIYATMLVLNVISIVFTCTALISHYYPEAHFVSPPPIADAIVSPDKTDN